MLLNFAAESSTILQPSNTQSQRDRDPEVKKIRKKADDGVFNYACRLLSYGLLSRDFQDGTKEGDRPRICRLRKFCYISR